MGVKRQYLKEKKVQEEFYPEDYIEVGQYLKDVKYGQGYVTLEKVKMDIENAPYNFTLADVLNAASRYGFELKELSSGTALVQKGSSINEDLAKMSKEDQGCSDKPAYADAVRDLEETEKAKEEYRKLPKADKVEEKPKRPKMVPGAKKMKLDESLFEEIDWQTEAVDSIGRKRPDTYKKREPIKKPLSLQVYDGLEALGYEVKASFDSYGYELSKRFEKNLEKAKDFLTNLGVKFNVKNIRDRFYLTISLPDEEAEVDNYFKQTDRSMVMA